MFATTTPAYLEGLNEQQADAALHGDGPLLIVAGAGTGKTKTLAARVAALLDRGVAPERILLLTFTRRAARELVGRAEQMVGVTRPGKVWGGTFHSVANRLIRMHAPRLGLAPSFTVMDQSDGADLLDMLRLEKGIGGDARRFARKETLAAIYSRAVNAGMGLTDVLRSHYPWCVDDAGDIAIIFKEYVERKRAQSILDYDDLLLFWRALLASPEDARRVGGRFDHILVDEYQDTNSLQADILVGMAKGCPNVTVVGDDAQAIYSFRAASVDNILEFPARHEGTTLIALERNYRSTEPILEVSNAVIAQARRRYEKELRSGRTSAERPTLRTCLDETEQCEAVCTSVLALRDAGTVLRDQAVLFRAGHHSTLLEFELTRRNIPYVKYGGLRYLEAAHIKDALAFLRVLENPHDELSWFRLLQLVRGVGPSAARRIMDALGVRTAATEGARDPVHRLLDDPPRVAPAAEPEVAALREALADCIGGDAPAPAVQLDRAARWLEPLFARKYEGAGARLRDLEQLAQIAARFRTRAEFIADLTLDPPASTADLAGPPLVDEDYLVLSTIHSAKGCEWDAVHIIHVADGMIPSDMAAGDDDELDEELRLFYVAMTRAKNVLNLYFPLRYYHRPSGLADPHSYAQLTRFISDDVKELLELHEGSVGARDEVVETARGDAVAAVSKMLGDLWSS